ncbi:uncharacterized protein LOC119689317 [Teleopsis dalmanni]|uniref:uncharacterized protein LOC119689317 n=1 Tax=Teleopsis dalmanni TaxID=139649 RepID=UPI0018CF25C4|nr:uncharacterized protein LOC119689317 [Teleopsis dalmanni]
MDVWGVFAGDSTMSYGGSIRNTYYRDFEQFPYGTLENCSTVHTKDSYSRVQEKCNQIKSEKAQKKECPFCKEHKKRPLINYMRKRDSRKHHESICEDEEEHEHEEPQEVKKQPLPQSQFARDVKVNI